MPHGRYWLSSDVKQEGHSPEAFMKLRADICCVPIAAVLLNVFIAISPQEDNLHLVAKCT